eukprot:scaffold175713_cov45-Attheya_sp.AAC.1
MGQLSIRRCRALLIIFFHVVRAKPAAAFSTIPPKRALLPKTKIDFPIQRIEESRGGLKSSQAGNEWTENVDDGKNITKLKCVPSKGSGAEDEIERITKEKEEPVVVSAPTVKQILHIAIPAIGIWLCSPLLSMIDTSAVGMLAGTAQQAACACISLLVLQIRVCSVNPAVAVTDYSARCMAFLYTGTTNLVAASRSKESRTNLSTTHVQTSQTLIAALQLSVWVGAGLGAFLLVFAHPILKAFIGNDDISPTVFHAALRYVRIRAVGMPAAAMIGSAQSACLGLQDVKSPLLVMLLAATVNLVVDVLVVGRTNNIWISGAAGAAWATTFSQYVAVAVFLQWLCTKSTNKLKVKERKPFLPLRMMSPLSRIRKGTYEKNNTFSTRGLLAGQLKWRDMFFGRP